MKSNVQLVLRLNQIMREQEELKTKLTELDKEYKEIAYELWDRIPSLNEDIPPKKRVKVK